MKSKINSLHIPCTKLLLTGLTAFALMFSACTTIGTPDRPGTVAKPPLPEPQTNPHIFYFLQAELSKNKGHLDQALDYIQKAIKADQESIYLKIELAKIYVYKNDIDKADSVISQGLETHPENKDLLSIFAQIKLIQGKDQEVPPIFEKILSLDPKDQAVYFLLGGLYSKMNYKDKAINVFQRLTKHFPESFSGHYYLGKLYIIEKNYAEAEKELKIAYALNSELVEALYSLIQIYELENKTNLLPGIYTQILESAPDDIRASLALSLFHHSNKKEEQAQAILSRLGRQSSTDPNVLRYLVRYYIKKDLYSEAIYLIEGILATTGNPDDYNYFLGICREHNGNPKQAILAFQKVSPQSSFYEKSILLSAFHYLDKKEYTKSIALLENALMEKPDNTEFILYLGSFYEEEDQHQKAVDMYKRGVTIDPENTRMRFRLGVVLDKLGDRIACIEEMKHVVDLDPEDPNALNYLGYTYADLGMNLEEAQELIEKALTFKPDDGYITDSLGWVHYKKGDYKKAVTLLEKAVKLIPDDPILLEHLGDALIKTSAHKKALESYRKSLENKKEDKDTKELKVKIENLMNKLTSMNP